MEHRLEAIKLLGGKCSSDECKWMNCDGTFGCNDWRLLHFDHKDGGAIVILLSLDFESTGIDIINDRIIEVGAILWSTGQRKCLESYGRLVKSEVPVSAEITEITGITQSAVDRFGFDLTDVLEDVAYLASEADALIGQNIVRFDKRVLDNNLIREGMSPVEKLVIDTMTDLPGVTGRHLGYMMADIGCLNMFPHSALADCQSVLKILDYYCKESRDPEAYLQSVLVRAKSPVVVVQSLQARSNNADAKEFKFWWNPENKLWWKPMKLCDVDALKAEAPFEIVIRTDLTEDQLRND